MNWSEQEYQDYCKRKNKQEIEKNYEKEKKNKYGNQKVTYFGIEFDSKKEGLRYLQLKAWLENGTISNLILQPVFLLQEKFIHNDKKYQSITYVADFSYIDCNGKKITEDVKASKNFTTTIYKLKKKLLMFKYPDINFIEAR